MSLSKLNTPTRDIAVVGLEASGVEAGSINVNSGQGGGDGILALNNGNQQFSLSIDNSTKECRIGVANFTGSDVSYPDLVSFTPVGTQPTNQYVMSMTGSQLQVQNRVPAGIPWYPGAPPGVVSYGNSYVSLLNNPTAAADEAGYYIYSAGSTVPAAPGIIPQTVRNGYITGNYPSGGYTEENQTFIEFTPSQDTPSGLTSLNLGLPLGANRIGSITCDGTPQNIAVPSVELGAYVHLALVGTALGAPPTSFDLPTVTINPGVGFTITGPNLNIYSYIVFG